MSEPGDIRNAETYADALEIAGKAEIEYKAGVGFSGVYKNYCRDDCCLGCFLLVIASMFSIYGIAVLGLYMLYKCITYRVVLRNGYLSVYTWFVRIRKIPISEILWPARRYSSQNSWLYYFATRGKRISTPPAASALEAISADRIFNILRRLGKMKLAAEADNIIEGRTPIPVPLSEGSTHRRVLILALAILIVLPISIGLLVGGSFIISEHVDPNRADPILLAVILFLFLPGFGGGACVLYGIIRFITIYGLKHNVFTPDGFLTKHGRFVPYKKLELVFYRRFARLESPYPGILEISIEGQEPIYIGPERENFFLLPYILEMWAEDRFRFRHSFRLPFSIQALQYREAGSLLGRFRQEPEEAPPRETENEGDDPDGNDALDAEQPNK
ncbi:MAG: hypothetical protein ACYS8W_05565 [Planctomycetota bacterium]|jgi:hypothetical protein